MINALEELQEKLSALEDYILGLEALHALLLINTKPLRGQLKAPVQAVQSSHARQAHRPRIEYSTLVISLYGYLERFIEESLRQYLKRLTSIYPSFLGLPSSVQNSNLDKSISHFDSIRKSKKTEDLSTIEQVVWRLHTCYFGENDYTLNYDAFLYHSSNFRLNVIDSAFKEVGVNNTANAISCRPAWRTYVDTSWTIFAHSDGYYEKLQLDLEELASRRNAVAHGSEQQLLSYDEVRDLAKTVQILAQVLQEILDSDLIRHRIMMAAVRIGKPVNVFTSGVVHMRVGAPCISVGDIIFAKPHSEHEPYLCGRVTNIHRNRRQITNFQPQGMEDVTLKLDITVRTSHELYVVHEAGKISDNLRNLLSVPNAVAAGDYKANVATAVIEYHSERPTSEYTSGELASELKRPSQSPVIPNIGIRSWGAKGEIADI